MAIIDILCQTVKDQQNCKKVEAKKCNGSYKNFTFNKMEIMKITCFKFILTEDQMMFLIILL